MWTDIWNLNFHSFIARWTRALCLILLHLLGFFRFRSYSTLIVRPETVSAQWRMAFSECIRRGVGDSTSQCSLSVHRIISLHLLLASCCAFNVHLMMFGFPFRFGLLCPWQQKHGNWIKNCVHSLIENSSYYVCIYWLITSIKCFYIIKVTS